MDQEIHTLKAQLKEAEHKRLEVLANNVELLAKIAEKDKDITAMHTRFEQLKTKKANAVLN